VDTRRKILTQAAAARLSDPFILVTGHFELLRADQVRELEAIRRRAHSRALLAAVVPRPGAIWDADACARLAASLRVIDYVVTVDHDDLEGFIERLHPAEIVRLQDADFGRLRRLIEDARRRNVG
jgi:hypothetical protein